jgi:hypothetical protein
MENWGWRISFKTVPRNHQNQFWGQHNILTAIYARLAMLYEPPLTCPPMAHARTCARTIHTWACHTFPEPYKYFPAVGTLPLAQWHPLSWKPALSEFMFLPITYHSVTQRNLTPPPGPPSISFLCRTMGPFCMDLITLPMLLPVYGGGQA